MAPSAQVIDDNRAKPERSAFVLAIGLKAAWRGAVEYAKVCASYHAGARLYEELRGLSDAELRRRGLSRDTVARDICAACGRIDRT